MIEKAGATLVPLPAGEFFYQLQQGKVDGGEMSTPAMDAALGFDKLGLPYYMPGWQQPSAVLDFLMRKDKWQELPASLRAQIETACRANIAWTLEPRAAHPGAGAREAQGLRRGHQAMVAGAARRLPRQRGDHAAGASGPRSGLRRGLGQPEGLHRAGVELADDVPLALVRSAGQFGPAMTVLSSAIDTRSDTFKKNAETMRGLVDDLRARTDKVRLGGGEEQRKRHVARGKLLPRERVRALLDPGSPFLELSTAGGAWTCTTTRRRAPASSPASAG